MAILEHQVRSGVDAAVTGLNRRLFSREDYYRMSDEGFFDGQRIELIEGVIIQMAPIGFADAAVTEPLAVQLKAAFGSGFSVRSQAPVSLGEDRKPSEPQPDISVVQGEWRDYLNRHPNSGDIKLIVEISDSTLSDDRITKAALYAASEIPEYWIVNLVDRQLEVYRLPQNGLYTSTTIFSPGQSLRPLNASAEIGLSSFVP